MSTATTPSSFTCPRCHKKLRFKKAPVDGTRFNCPGCGGSVTYTSPSPTTVNNGSVQDNSDPWVPAEWHRPAPFPALRPARPIRLTDRPPARKTRSKKVGIAMALFVVIPIPVCLTLLAVHYVPGLIKNPVTGIQVAAQPAPAQPAANPLNFFKKALKPGKARIHVTWEYNKYVGNRPDTGAVAILVPKGIQEKADFFGLDPISLDRTFDMGKKTAQQKGVYAAKVGGNGALISNVPEGDYTLIILSKNTNDSPAARNADEAKLADYFTGTGGAGLHKMHFTDLTIVAGEEAEYDHDFGNTYFSLL